MILSSFPFIIGKKREKIKKTIPIAHEKKRNRNELSGENLAGVAFKPYSSFLVSVWASPSEKKLKTRRIKPSFAPYLFHLEKGVISLFQLKSFCGLPKLKQGNTHTNTSSLFIAPRKRMLFFCFSATKKLTQSAEIRTQENSSPPHLSHIETRCYSPVSAFCFRW